jgi:hypothetical protein
MHAVRFEHLYQKHHGTPVFLQVTEAIGQKLVVEACLHLHTPAVHNEVTRRETV